MAARRLDALITGVLTTGMLCLAAAGFLAATGPQQDWWQVAAVVVVSVAGGLAQVDLRIGSNRVRFVWGEAALVVSLVLVDLPWVVLATATGVLVSDAVSRVPVRKLLFNIGTGALAATAGGTVLHLVTGPSVELTVPRDVAALLAAALVFSGGCHLAVSGAVGLSQSVPVRAVYSDGLGPLLLGLGANLVGAFAALGLAWLDIRLLIVIPSLWWATHEGFAGRVRARSERRAWRRLALVTQQLTALEREGVVAPAVAGAAGLFSADVVEITLVGGAEGGECYRGDRAGLFDDPDACVADAEVVREPLGEGGELVGELRLCFYGPVTLSERERLALSAFAAALAAALRNARAHEKLQELADRKAYEAAHDPLTGLANRAGLWDGVASLLAAKQRSGQTAAAALLLLDLNHFKEINDTLGHAAGDRVLVAAAHGLTNVVRPGEVLARLGGDEFALLVPIVDPERAANEGIARARAIRDAVAETTIRLDDIEVEVEASVGVATAQLGELELDELLRRADVAMYQAKRGDGSVALYEAARDAGSLDRLTLASELRAALQRSEELIVHLQPVVDLQTGEPLGAEALSRWNHPRRGLLFPGDFIDTVEESDLAGPFTRRVLDLALAERNSWLRHGLPPLPVSVNLPVRLLLDRDFPAAVAELLARHRVPPGDLVLEITERVMMSELETVDTVLAALREIGVQLSIDDFGTGYSSLSLLTRLPVTEVKIDREFVNGMATSSGNAVVVRTVVEIGRALGLRVVAEGIETDAQRNALAALGCTAGQGYLFCPPVSAEKARAALWAFASTAESENARAAVIPMGSARRSPQGGRDRT